MGKHVYSAFLFSLSLFLGTLEIGNMRRLVTSSLRNLVRPVGMAISMPAIRHASTTTDSSNPLTPVEAPLRSDEKRDAGDGVPSDLSAQLHEPAAADENEASNGDFDELEAVCQELFDATSGMRTYAKMGTTRWDHPSFFQKPHDSVKHRLVHQRVVTDFIDTTGYPTAANHQAAAKLYMDLGAKVVKLLTAASLDRLVASAGKRNRENGGTKRKKERNLLKRAHWTKFPVSHYSKAPYELQQLRSDIPQELVLNARSLRDYQTLRNLMELVAGREHPYRAELERIMWSNIEKWDLHFRQELGSPPS